MSLTIFVNNSGFEFEEGAIRPRNRADQAAVVSGKTIVFGTPEDFHERPEPGDHVLVVTSKTPAFVFNEPISLVV